MSTPTGFPALLERFFTQRLMQQRQASPHTISSYRDTFRQFLKFVQKRLHKPPSGLRFEEIDAPMIVAFLDDLEQHGLTHLCHLAQQTLCKSITCEFSKGVMAQQVRDAWRCRRRDCCAVR